MNRLRRAAGQMGTLSRFCDLVPELPEFYAAPYPRPLPSRPRVRDSWIYFARATYVNRASARVSCDDFNATPLIEISLRVTSIWELSERPMEIGRFQGTPLIIRWVA